MSQAVRDALADAETLVRVTRELRGYGFGSIFDAAYAIEWAPDQAKRHAYISAHVAFLAVPSLRCDCEATR